MSANKLRGKAYADFLLSMTPLERDDYMDAHPMERFETERAMTPNEFAEYLQAINESLPPELQDDNDDDNDDDQDDDQDDDDSDDDKGTDNPEPAYSENVPGEDGAEPAYSGKSEGEGEPVPNPEEELLMKCGELEAKNCELMKRIEELECKMAEKETGARSRSCLRNGQDHPRACPPRL